MTLKRPNFTSLTTLFGDWDVTTKVSRYQAWTFYWHTGAISAGCPSCRHQWLI